MNILWLPHAPLSTRGRTNHLIERLSRRHDISAVDFNVYAPGQRWRYFRDLLVHRSRSAETHKSVALCRFPKAGILNGWILKAALRKELSDCSYDAMVVAPAPYLTGYLDFETVGRRMPIICDYLDGLDWAGAAPPAFYERLYARRSDAVMCVSNGLLRQARSVNKHAYYVPNGVDLARYESFAARHTMPQCKQQLGIEPDNFVVSIIGMTCSKRLYFVDSVVNLAKSGRKMTLLLVGDSPLFGEIRRRWAGWEHVIRCVGTIPYEEVQVYFQASDVGLNAVDDESYYHFQSPLKILEYSAMRKPVLVSPKLDEVMQWHLPNVLFCEPTAADLEQAIARVMDGHGRFETSVPARFDWDEIAKQVEEVILEAVGRRKKPSNAGGTRARNDRHDRADAAGKFDV